MVQRRIPQLDRPGSRPCCYPPPAPCRSRGSCCEQTHPATLLYQDTAPRSKTSPPPASIRSSCR
jgi:hypothetical protein